MKRSTSDLAIFGGAPAFQHALHVGRPNIGDRERLFRRLDAMLGSRWLTNGGPLVQEFEQRVAETVGVRHCVAVCNATVALQIVAHALGLTGEVIVPSFTFVATAHALRWVGLKPVFCDIDPGTHTLDPSRVEQLITPRTSAAIGVHLWGRPCAIDDLTEIGRRHGLRIVFDAAHAFACSYRGEMIGGFGDAEVFSFHATKFLNALEGGAIVTNSDELATKCRLMKTFGFEDYDRVVCLGTNGKMNEAVAAMGLTSLESMEEFVASNRENYQAYLRSLTGIRGVTLLEYAGGERYNYHYIVLEIDARDAGVTRDQLHAVLHAENVLARRYFSPGVHRMEPYRSSPEHTPSALPVTERVADRVLCLPTGSSVSALDTAIIGDIIRFAVGNAGEIADPVQAA